MPDSPILDIQPLGFQWPTIDPFLFCVHHHDAYPAGNGEMGPAASLAGRNIGQDFTPKDGWRMYHGDRVPGFPAHPHRGFETVTVVLKGFIDHSDSFGAAGRYGEGDVQWMTAGAGMQHAEMFPLLREDAPNPLELFQIWLNLPKKNKMVDPHYKMLWAEDIPVLRDTDGAGRGRAVRLIAGMHAETVPPAPPPESRASDTDADVAIWIIALDADAEWTLPATRQGARRMLYFFEGESIDIGGATLPAYHAAEVHDDAVVLRNGPAPARLLLLQARPLAEPVAQYGPFVMNTEGEIRQAFLDYQKTQFGGWPWERPDPVHPRDSGRFARYPDGRSERRP